MSRLASRRSCRAWRNGAGATAATCVSMFAGVRPIPTAAADTRPNWLRSRRMSSLPTSTVVAELQEATQIVPIAPTMAPVIVWVVETCCPQDRRRALERGQRRCRGLDRDAARGGVVRRRVLRALQISFLTRVRGVILPGVMAFVLKRLR